jgi:excinuclease UvrABC ATPase subunit
VLHSGPLPDLADVSASLTRLYLFDRRVGNARMRRPAQGWLKLRGVTRNNLDRLDVDIPLGLLTSVTRVSGSGKSSLISQFLVEANRREAPAIRNREPSWSLDIDLQGRSDDARFCDRTGRPWRVSDNLLLGRRCGLGDAIGTLPDEQGLSL